VLCAPQPHAPGLRGRTLSPSFIAVELWTCISVGNEPLHYAKSPITDVCAKMPFRRFAPHNYSLRILQIMWCTT
jgi:hypothetical protein